MALRFRSRLNLTFSTLLFLVIVVMSLSQIGILLYDTWENGWYKGRTLTELINPNISHGLDLKENAEAYLNAQIAHHEALEGELLKLKDGARSADSDLQPLLTILEQRPEAIDPTSSELVRDSFGVQSLLARHMVSEEFRMMIIVSDEGLLLAEVTGEGFSPSDQMRSTIDNFIQEFVPKLASNPTNPFDYNIFGSDMGVITPLSYPSDSGLRYCLFVLHSSERQARLIGDRLGILAVIGTILFFGALLVCVFVSRGLTKPLLELSRGAQAFGEGNLNYRMKLKRKDEFNELAQSFNVMAISIQEYMHELERETGKRERLESEFRIASEMQQALLPDAPPEVPSLKLIGWSQPSKEVGGDFYDFLELGDNKIGLVLGDATGKGVPAALLTTQCASALRTLSNEFHDPAELLYRTNNEFHKRVGATHRFVTLFLLVIDTQTGIARYTSAGHPAPLLVRAETGKSEWLVESSGFPLGIVNQATYEVHDVALRPGDTIYIFSDGLTDARNHEDTLYGESNIQQSVESTAQASVDDILRNTRKDVEKYMNGKESTDDMTVIVMKYVGNE